MLEGRVVDMRVDRATGLPCPCRSACKCHPVCRAFSPGGQFLAVGGSGGVLTMFSMDWPEPPRIVACEAHHRKQIDSLAFSGPSRLLSTSADGSAAIWEHGVRWTPRTLDMRRIPNGRAQSGGPARPRWSSGIGRWTCDGGAVCCTYGPQNEETHIFVWSTETLVCTHQLDRHEYQIQELP